MIYKLDSIDRVVDKVIRDLGLGDNEIPYTDFIEWSADALEHIGSYYQNEEKECMIVIEDYHGALPCDFYKPIRFLNGCSVTPGEGGFYGGTLVESLNKIGFDYESAPAYERFKEIHVAGIAKPSNQYASIDSLVTGLNLNKNLIGNPTTNKFSDMDWNLNFNKITAAFRYGIIQVQYLAMPVDDRGFPLVPDDVSFRDALMWKIAYHLSMRDPKLLKNPQMQNMEYCRQMWSKYCGQARASANMPNLDMALRMKNNWLKLHNNPNADDNLFATSGIKQRLNLDGRY